MILPHFLIQSELPSAGEREHRAVTRVEEFKAPVGVVCIWYSLLDPPGPYYPIRCDSATAIASILQHCGSEITVLIISKAEALAPDAMDCAAIGRKRWT